MMEKKISTRLIFCVLLACLQIATVYSGCFKGTCAREEDCLDKFNAVTSFVKLRKFLKNIDAGFDDGLTTKDVQKCLGFDSADGLRQKIIDFLVLIDNSRHGEICLMENINRLATLNWKLSPLNPLNSELRLSPWWEKFVKEVILKCESSLTKKLDLNRPHDSTVESLTNLANSFNWKNVDNFLEKGSDYDSIVPDENESLDTKRLEGSKSGIVGELYDVTFDVDEKSISEQIRHDTKMNNEQLARLQEMFSRCNYVGSYKKRLIEPLLELSKFGHLDGSSIKPISTNRYQYIYLPALKMCALLKHVTVLKLSDGTVRFKAGKSIDDDELDAQKLDTTLYPFRPHIYFDVEYPKGLDSFEELDSELLEKVKMSDEGSPEHLQRLNYAANLKKAVYSEAFLKKIADYIETTREFQPPIEQGVRFTN